LDSSSGMVFNRPVRLPLTTFPFITTLQFDAAYPMQLRKLP
jgi:hypothetical protein